MWIFRLGSSLGGGVGKRASPPTRRRGVRKTEGQDQREAELGALAAPEREPSGSSTLFPESASVAGFSLIGGPNAYRAFGAK